MHDRYQTCHIYSDLKDLWHIEPKISADLNQEIFSFFLKSKAPILPYCSLWLDLRLLTQSTSVQNTPVHSPADLGKRANWSKSPTPALSPVKK